MPNTIAPEHRDPLPHELTQQQVAELLGITVDALAVRRTRGADSAPVFHKRGRRPFVTRAAYYEWSLARVARLREELTRAEQDAAVAARLLTESLPVEPSAPDGA